MKYRFNKFKFSIRNYYLLFAIFIIALFVYSLKINSFMPIVIFLAFSILGVIGETFVNFWWRMFFGKRLWSYNTQTLYHKHTSFLNFIPWGIGGYLYLIIANQIAPISDYTKLSFIFLFLFPVLATIQKLIFDLFKPYTHFKFDTVNLINLLFFYFPIFITIGFAILIYGWNILLIFILFAIIATTAEYLFGKIFESTISKKLWTYNYLSFDNGHFTPISILLFAYGGFYFLIVAQYLSSL